MAFLLSSVQSWSRLKIDWTSWDPILESYRTRLRSWWWPVLLGPLLSPHLLLLRLLLPLVLPALSPLVAQLLEYLPPLPQPLALEGWLPHLAHLTLPLLPNLPLLPPLMDGRWPRVGPKARSLPPSPLRLIYSSLSATRGAKVARKPIRPMVRTGPGTWEA